MALHQVTDDFIAYIRAMGDDWDLDEASEFLVVAATLLDLKAARLLPAAEVEDEEDLALLEARDLLFARLLQYKAFKEAAAHLPSWRRTGARRWPRAVSLEPRYAEALPDLVLGIGPDRLSRWRVKAMTPKPVARRSRSRTSTRCGSASASTPTLLRDRLLRAGHRHVPAADAPTARTPWRWWPGSWRCWSCTARAWSASSRCRRWAS